MDLDIDILIEDSAWQALDLPGLTEAALRGGLSALDFAPVSGVSLSVLACDDARIAVLNAQFRGREAPTNVLSWPAEERSAEAPGAMPSLPEADKGPIEIGDLALAYGVCASEAAAAGKPLADHVTHLLVHGILHCLGFDHETDADATLMEGLETVILANLGVPDPY